MKSYVLRCSPKLSHAWLPPHRSGILFWSLWWCSNILKPFKMIPQTTIYENTLSFVWFSGMSIGSYKPKRGSDKALSMDSPEETSVIRISIIYRRTCIYIYIYIYVYCAWFSVFGDFWFQENTSHFWAKQPSRTRNMDELIIINLICWSSMAMAHGQERALSGGVRVGHEAWDKSHE